jgi:hypothetical protein
MTAHSSYRAVASAVSGVGHWGLERSQRSNSSHMCSIGFSLGLWAGQFILKPYCPQAIPSLILLYGREHCHADTANCLHQTGLL